MVRWTSRRTDPEREQEMNELVTRFTALPNLHPALVHFPIALLPMAVIFDLLMLWLRRERGWLDRAASALYLAAGLGAGAAYWAGERAADSLPILLPHLQLHVNEHSDSALYTLWLIGPLAVARVSLTFWDGEARRGVLRFLVLVVALVGVGMLFRTADLGGGLVYQHGIAVAERGEHEAEEQATSVTDEAGPSATSEVEEVARAGSRLIERADGSLEWRPRPGDREALGSVLRPATGSLADAVSWGEPTDESSGLRLMVDGSALLLLPGTYGDVQVEAEIDLEDFVGEVGLAHHVRSANQAGIMTLSVPANEFSLVTVDGETTKRLDRSVGPVPSESLQLTVSAVGRHSRGLLADTVVVHGHEPALPEGGCGLLLRGRGEVRVLAMRVKPVRG
jgi:uncharacterized membrane protein